MMDAQRPKMGIEEFSLLSPLRVYSGDFAEFAGGALDDGESGGGAWDISSNIVPFRPQGFGISGPIGGMMSLRLRGGSNQFGANVMQKSPDNATEPDKGQHSSGTLMALQCIPCLYCPCPFLYDACIALYFTVSSLYSTVLHRIEPKFHCIETCARRSACPA